MGLTIITIIIIIMAIIMVLFLTLQLIKDQYCRYYRSYPSLRSFEGPEPSWNQGPVFAGLFSRFGWSGFPCGADFELKASTAFAGLGLRGFEGYESFRVPGSLLNGRVYRSCQGLEA